MPKAQTQGYIGPKCDSWYRLRSDTTPACWPWTQYKVKRLDDQLLYAAPQVCVRLGGLKAPGATQSDPEPAEEHEISECPWG
ncbi:hypothetical protein Tdes44962_MAKER03760 [Teratosphaeria destructans]|uniref:Uncharacterized protein n=1 Tax=Teratosphaeria destructans TaxID=418781 RepID=A0A9W7SPD2_9PEZI|nr:hypothetical protein Tdes44962_MAKER03760 [Teratosphaeria destructans]